MSIGVCQSQRDHGSHRINVKMEVKEEEDDQPLDFSTKKSASPPQDESPRRSLSSSPEMKVCESPVHNGTSNLPKCSSPLLQQSAFPTNPYKFAPLIVNEVPSYPEGNIILPKRPNILPHHSMVHPNGTYIHAPLLPRLTVDTSSNTIKLNSPQTANEVSPADARSLNGQSGHPHFGLVHPVPPPPPPEIMNRLILNTTDSKTPLRVTRPFKSYAKDTTTSIPFINGHLVPYTGGENYTYAQYVEQYMDARRRAASKPTRVPMPSLGDSHDKSSNENSSESSPPESNNGSPSNGQSTVTSTNSSKKRIRSLPEELKDDNYWERRRKNNEAAKRSRDARRQKEDEIAIRCAFLEAENLRLRFENNQLKDQLYGLSAQLSR